MTSPMALLPKLGVKEKWCRLLPTLLSHGHPYTESHLDEVLDRHLPIYGSTLRKSVKEALAIATYQRQTAYPVVKLLLCDDAPQFNGLTVQLALCWVHEYRHYKKLTPRFLAHCDLLKRFAEEFWTLYRNLLAYRDHPSPAEADALRTAFDDLFGQTSGYQQLDERLARTRAKKDALRMVLDHPEILLHNNPAELGARQRVRKRDVSAAAHAPEKASARGILFRRWWGPPTSSGSMCTSIFMTASLTPTCCPVWPPSFNNERPRFTSPPPGLEQPEPCHSIAHTQKCSRPARTSVHACWSLSLHLTTLCIPPDDRFSLPELLR